MNRRTFIEFMGRGSLSIPFLPSLIASCEIGSDAFSSGKFPCSEDELILADGLEFDFLIKEGEQINDMMTFGSENDYIAYFPQTDDEGILWVNHENFEPLFVSGYDSNSPIHNQKMLQTEMQQVGGTILKIRKKNGKWEKSLNDPFNKRLTAESKIPFEPPILIENFKYAVGTLANCSGGQTPWGTVLTCEENYNIFYGEYDFETGLRSTGKLKWQNFFPQHHPHHYGWVVEVNLQTGSAKKHIGLGRMAHECATVKELPDGRVVIYTGDDIVGGCIYKFISDEPRKISPGKLYAANCDDGRWELIDNSRPEIEGLFKDQTELMIRARYASPLLGGTKLDRPEDIEIDPITGNVLISLTNNKSQENYHGSILSITEKGGYDSLEFSHDNFLTGGEQSGFSCPDNMAFDAVGNLWFCSDISGSSIGKKPYESFGNNGLFVLVRNGESSGKLFQVGSAPNDAELTGLYFLPDKETLLMSVQHPGTESPDLSQLTSNWPDGGTAVPRSAVVAISGKLIRSLQNSI